MRSLLPCIPFILVCLSTTLNAALDHPIKICGIRVSFLEDDLASTTGNGQFFDGKMIFLSGSPEMEKTGGILTGRLSGIVNHFIPFG